MIEKKKPRVLNTSKDSRVRGAEEMHNALNINASSDYGEQDEGGNIGVLKAAYGNSILGNFQGVSEESTKRVIGSVLDDQHNVIYYFLWSSIAKEQGVYAYDPDGFFMSMNGNENQVKLVYN